MLVTVLKVIGVMVAVFVFLVVGAFAIKGSPSVDTLNSNTVATAYLEKNKESYVACANSVGSEGKILISSVVTENIVDHSLEELEAIEQAFLQQVKSECKEQIEEYEAAYADLKKTEQEIAEANLSMLEEYLGIEAEPDQQKLRAYNPTMVKFFVGKSVLSNLVFTEAEVREYFEDRL